MTLYRRITYCAVAVGAVVTLSGCGNLTATTPPAVNSESRPTEVRAFAQATFERWYGTERQRDAGEVLVAYAANGGTAKCMSDQGFEWDWSTSRMSAPYVDALARTVWFAEPRRRVWTDDLLTAAAFRRAEVVMNSDGTLTPAEDKAMTECLNGKASVGDDELYDIRRPHAQQELTDQWNEALHAVSKDYGSSQDYERCMNSADLPLLKGRTYTSENIYHAFRAYTPEAKDVPVGAEKAGEPWTELIAMETPVVEADWRCRQDVYQEGISKLAPAISAFAESHDERIDESTRYWAGVEERARALGWDPDTRTVRITS